MFTRIETYRLDQAHADDATDKTAKESPDRKRTEDSRAAMSATEESSGDVARNSSGDVTPESRGDITPESSGDCDRDVTPEQLRMSLKWFMFIIILAAAIILFICSWRSGGSYFFRLVLYVITLNLLILMHHLHSFEDKTFEKCVEKYVRNSETSSEVTSDKQKTLVRIIGWANFSFVYYFACFWTLREIFDPLKSDEGTFMRCRRISSYVVDVFTTVCFSMLRAKMLMH